MLYSTKNDIKPGSVSHSLATQNTLSKYIKSISMMSMSSAREYRFRLQGFGDFITREYKIALDRSHKDELKRANLIPMTS